MRCLLMFVAAAVVTSGFAFGGEPQQPNENLKDYGPFIGTWRYEGPLLEDVPGMAEKGSEYVVQVTFRFILDKKVVMDDWTVEFAGGKKIHHKGLTGWNAADEELKRGSMDSVGGMSLGTIKIDDDEKTNTLTAEVLDSEGNKSSFKGVITKTGKDSFTWQALERSGGDIEGPSPVYEFKRVKRTKGKKAAKPGDVSEHLKGFRPFIGIWRHEGPVLEKGPLGEEAGESTKMIFDISLRWILDKQVEMGDWSIEFEGGTKASGKLLTGWNAAEEKIMGGGMDSTGRMAITSYVFNSEAKTLTETAQGVDGEGEEWSIKNVITKTGKDTLTWQRVEGTGRDIEGPSPVYEFKRVKRTKGKKAAK